jgi:MerR family transcriptional regulator, light-induced transcriptional regulator
MPSRYSIKDLERLSGIKAHTLRIWEQRYDILKPERTDTNIRYYRDADLKRILNISLLNNNGYKISKISKLSDEEVIREVEKLLSSYKSESDQIENLVMCLMELDEDRFEKTISNSVIHFGFENTVEKIVFPFLKQLGNMWQVGMITPAQEHFVSNLIRQKLIVGIDQLNPGKVTDAQTVLFFLPNGELHEIGLLYCHFLAKSRGHRCIYLGQSVPFEDVVSIATSVKPEKLVTVLTASLSDTEPSAYFQLLSSAIPDAEFLVSGRLLLHNETSDLNLPPKFTLFREFSDFKKII